VSGTVCYFAAFNGDLLGCCQFVGLLILIDEIDGEYPANRREILDVWPPPAFDPVVDSELLAADSAPELSLRNS
jgi:hypothetical protein